MIIGELKYGDQFIWRGVLCEVLGKSECSCLRIICFISLCSGPPKVIWDFYAHEKRTGLVEGNAVPRFKLHQWGGTYFNFNVEVEKI